MVFLFDYCVLFLVSDEFFSHVLLEVVDFVFACCKCDTLCIEDNEKEPLRILEFERDFPSKKKYVLHACFALARCFLSRRMSFFFAIQQDCVKKRLSTNGSIARDALYQCHCLADPRILLEPLVSRICT